MNTFIISDTHFNHKNIIDYCDRPFTSVEQMNDFIVEKWNEVVNNGDIVYHLGDLALGKQEDVRPILTKLKGRKTLILGNHDHFSVQFYRECGFQVSRRPSNWCSTTTRNFIAIFSPTFRKAKKTIFMVIFTINQTICWVFAPV